MMPQPNHKHEQGFAPSQRSAQQGFVLSRRSAQQGFTLIELLVALTIFAMLAGAGVLLLGNSVSAQAQVKIRLDELAAVQRAGGAISRTENGTLAPAFWAHRGGEGAPVMQFVRGGWSNLNQMPRSSLQKIEYWVRQGRLERRSYPFVDGAFGSEPAVLLDGIEDVALRFRDARGDWREDWTPGQPDLMPRAVEAVVTRRGEPPVTLRFLVGPGPAERPLVEGAPNG
jgi:general secretion pathway protein J